MPNPLFDMSGDATLVIPETHTVGGAWIDHLATGVAPSGAKLLTAYFPPGSHTTWHMHPRGQLLHVVSGALLMQERGSEPHLLRAGDSHACPPGQWHWHGAAPDAFTIQFSVVESDEDGRDTLVGEPVRPQEYEAACLLARA